MSPWRRSRAETPSGEDTPETTPTPTPGRLAARLAASPVVWLAPLAVTLVFGFVALRAANRISESPTFCNRCHEMDWQVKSLAASPHQNAACVDCHSGPGAFGWFQHAASGLRSFAGHLVGKEPEAAAEVRDTWCLTCHADILTRELALADTRVAHKAFAATGQRCVFCHRDLVHGPEGRILDAEGEGGTGVRRGRAVRAPPDGPPVVTPVGERTCTTCHQASTCEDCHRVPMPHAPDWLTTHGRENPHVCARCHEQPRFCDTCHGTEIPHPPDWAVAHAEKTPEPERCVRCHEQKQCAVCHDQHQHGFLPDAKPDG
ncbi:MAG TPA: NapC/NirT family cytochrome c [Acidimicrobiia bacterium]|nr:NapC/NirT family cytochrome c [Acidimicrobiia bacterium]